MMVNLRERKRAETRQRISDCATRLFERNGFDTVTLAQIAGAADVSIKTVMNYFGAKEDLFFDAEPAICAALTSAVRERGSNSATAAVRPHILSSPILAGPCSWDAVTDPMWESMRIWAECERASATLTTRRAAITHSWMAPLTEASGSAIWAAMLAGILAMRHQLVQDGLIQRLTPDAVHHHINTTVGQALDALERGTGGIGSGRVGEARSEGR